jgi:glycosyltransferase involved in cell wall biosynthesis
MWRFAWQQFILPVWLLRMKIDVLLAPNDVAPILAPCKVVLGIQNANPYYGPRASTWLGRRREQFLRWLTRVSTWRAEKVFFVSEWSRQAISREIRLPLEKSCVIYHGVSERFHPREEKLAEQGEESSPYVLIVGSMRSHKDYITLFKAWRHIIANGYEHLKLLIVGPVLESVYYQNLNSLLNDLGIDGCVLFMLEASQDDIPRLYQAAAALVMPSYVETFGLPMVEAMACGIPIVASDIPVTHEVCGEAACYYRLGDPVDLAEKLALVLTRSDVRARLIKRGKERSSYFCWRNAAIQTLQLLRETLGSR